MFELETAISNWKRSLANICSLGSEETLELEEHLRESVMKLSNAGLSQREAFLIATDRLGHPSDLVKEYAKVEINTRWQRPAFWMLAGYLGMKAAGAAVSAVVALGGTTMAFAGVGGTAAGIVMIFLMAMTWIGLAVLAYRHVEGLGNSGESLPVRWMCVAGIMIIAGPILAFAGNLTLIRIVDPAWFGESAIYLSVGGFAMRILLVVICIVAMFKFGSSAKQTPVESV